MARIKPKELSSFTHFSFLSKIATAFTVHAHTVSCTEAFWHVVNTHTHTIEVADERTPTLMAEPWKQAYYSDKTFKHMQACNIAP